MLHSLRQQILETQKWSQEWKRLILTSSQEGKYLETKTYFILSASQSRWMVIAAMKLKDTCSLEEKDSMLRNRDITLLTKVLIVNNMFFQAIMYGYEYLTTKKAEYQRTDFFELWYWRRLLRVPYPARRSSQSILKEISPEYSLETLMVKLKLQYFGHLRRRADSLE